MMSKSSHTALNQGYKQAGPGDSSAGGGAGSSTTVVVSRPLSALPSATITAPTPGTAAGPVVRKGGLAKPKPSSAGLGGRASSGGSKRSITFDEDSIYRQDRGHTRQETEGGLLPETETVLPWQQENMLPAQATRGSARPTSAIVRPLPGRVREGIVPRPMSAVGTEAEGAVEGHVMRGRVRPVNRN